MSALPPGGTIGILGGGQLGRMLAHAAEQLGFDVAIYTDEEDSPAARVSAKTTIGDYLDVEKLTAFAKSVDVITTEFENVPAQTAEALIAAGARVAPNPHALAVAQDRFDEKSYFQSAGIATPAFAAVSSQEELEGAVADIGLPAILKTRRLGYDGRGQIRLLTSDDIAGAYDKLGAPGILEGFCNFVCEVSIIASRNADGAIA
ncbi:MAG TPA: ATP-grasp domain-containing protein, partial [Verrucomicrobiae bacterium]|nr:ATP-grasp domain-containing protein [Verrucomicrobiae bacterium]